MHRVVLATLFSLLISAFSAYATPILSITDDNGVTQNFSGSGNSVNASGTFGSFLISSLTVTALPGATSNDPNLLTLSNTQITNTGSGNATLALRYSNIFEGVNMTADRFYGTSMSGGFSAADPFGTATNASVALTAVVNYGVFLCEPFCLSGTGNIDVNKTFTVSTDNGFAPQNPSQGTATLGCLALAESGCSNPGLEQLSDQVFIFLHPGESISILATIVTLSAGSAEVRDIALAQFLPVPGPPTLILVGAGLLVPGVVGLGRKLRRNG